MLNSSFSAAFLALLLGVTASVQIAHAQTLEEIRDRIAITDALTQYAYRWDSKDATAFADLFTEDGELQRWALGELVADSVIQGRSAILDYARRSYQGRLADRQTRHHFSGIAFLDLNEDTAVTENMALITHQTAADPKAIISSSGIYRVTWLKIDGVWRMKKRVLFID